MVADDLRAAKALIDEPWKWCQHHAESEGRKCASYAIGVVVGFDFQEEQQVVKEALARAMGVVVDSQRGIAHFNDTHTHAEVMDAFDRAIAAEEEVLEPELAYA